jgi:hypothetical protein
MALSPANIACKVRTLLGISTGATSRPCFSNSRASLATQMIDEAPGAGEK